MELGQEDSRCSENPGVGAGGSPETRLYLLQTSEEFSAQEVTNTPDLESVSSVVTGHIYPTP